MKGIQIASLLLCTILFMACTKVEGEGGRSAIKGKIFVKNYNIDGILLEEYYAPDWPVYIVYGDDDYYGDKIDTHYDGTYLFEYLYPGTYTIYSYSKCGTCPGNFEVVLQTVEIEDKEVKVLDDIIVKD